MDSSSDSEESSPKMWSSRSEKRLYEDEDMGFNHKQKKKKKVYLSTKLGRDAIFRCKLTIDSRYKETSEKIDNYLNNEERATFFEHSPFGNLVRYHRDFNVSSQIIWYLMSSQIVDNGSDELWMVVRKRPVRFSMLEYCLLTGLDCAIEPDLPEKGGVFVSTHFVDKSEIFLSDLEAKIIVQRQNLTEGVDVEKLKMASLYFCCAVFGEGTRKKSAKIDPRCIRLIDDLDSFNRYPWGRVAYLAAVKGLKKDLLGRYTYLTEAHGRKEVDGSFLLGGFVLPLQILAYEYYPSVAQKFAKKRDAVDGLLLPRMFQWVTNTWSPNRAPSAFEVSEAFGACAIADCVGCLTPTLEELVSPYYMTGVFVDSAPDAVITRVLELWSQGQNVVCSQHPLDNDVESSPVQHASSSLDGSSASSSSHPDGSITPSADATRSSCSTRSPIHTGPRLYFERNPARSPSFLEDRFGERLTALEDAVKSLHLEMRAGFIETMTFIRDMNLSFDLLRSSLAEIRSQTPVRDPIDCSRKRKSSVLEADVGLDDNMVGELFPNTNQAEEAAPSPSVSVPVFEPNLPTIPEESSEETHLNADAGLSSVETTTPRADVVRPFVDSVTFKVNNSLARVRAAMLVHSPGMEKTGNLNRFVMRPTKVDGDTQNSSVDVPSTIGNARTGIVKDHSPLYSYQVRITPAIEQHDGSHTDGSGGSRFSASVVKFQGVKGFEDFKISVDGLILDSELPTDVRVKYYELCNSQKMFLHYHLITGLGSKLVSGVISETTNISDAIKSASITHSFHNLECWEKTLKAFEALGMNVGFIRTRVDKLVKISRQYQATNQPKEAKFAQLEARKKALGERVSAMETLQKSIATLQEVIKIIQKPIKNLEAEIDGIEGKNQELGLEFKEIATAAW